MKAPDSTFIRFLIAGGVNTLFGFLVYSAAILLGLPVWQALLAGNVTGVGFNFLTTGGYVFRDLSVSRFFRFSLAYSVIYLVNFALVMWLQRWIASTILIQVGLTVPMALGSYILMAKFVFRPSS